MSKKVVTDTRKRRHFRVRKKVRGTAERPRMSVFISNKHLYVQFVDDVNAVTLASASTVKGSGVKNLDAARKLGVAAAEAAKGKGINEVVFDRGGFSYEGRVQALADAARENGLRF